MCSRVSSADTYPISAVSRAMRSDGMVESLSDQKFGEKEDLFPEAGGEGEEEDIDDVREEREPVDSSDEYDTDCEPACELRLGLW